MRRPAARALGWRHCREAVPWLMAALADKTESVWLRTDAAMALGCIRDMSALPVVEQAAREWGDPRLRYEAASSAISLSHGALDDPSVVVPMGDWKPQDPFDEESHARETIQELKSVVRNGKTWAVRRTARQVIGKCGGSDAVLSPLFCLLFPLVAFAAWVGIYQSSLKQRQFTLRSLFVLITLIAVGLGAAAWLDMITL